MLGLQGNIYKNGTIFLFLKDKQGGLLFIQMYNPGIPLKLSKLSISSENIDENEWLWKLGPTVVRTKTMTKTMGSSIKPYGPDSSGLVTSFF